MNFGQDSIVGKKRLACFLAGFMPGMIFCTVAAAQAAVAARVAEILEDHPRLQAFQAAADAAQAQQRAAGQPLYNPELELEAERTEVTDVIVGIGQTIDWANKREARERVSAFEREAVEAELAAERLDLTTELFAAVAEYQTAQDLERLATSRVELMRRFVALAEQRWQVGDLTQAELDLARLTLTEATLQQAQASAVLAEAEQVLTAIIGGPPGVWPPLPEDLPSLPETLDPEARLAALPAVRARQARVMAAQATVRLRARERKPDPTLGLRGGREDEENLIGLSVSIPLFVRNTFRAEVDAANAEAIRAEREVQDAYRRAGARLVSVAQRYRQARQAWQAWQQTGEAGLTRQTALLQRLWQAGEIGTTEYVVQLNQTVDTRIAAIELRGQLWRAWTDWLAASGEAEPWLELAK